MAEKDYRGIKIWVEDYDEYAYFKRTLNQTFKNDSATLQSIIEEQFMRHLYDQVLRCKRVRVGGKEVIRVIY